MTPEERRRNFARVGPRFASLHRIGRSSDVVPTESWQDDTTPGRVGTRPRCPITVAPMTTAQVVFAAALGSIAIGISLFALYVVSSTVWGDRWVRKGRQP